MVHHMVHSEHGPLNLFLADVLFGTYQVYESQFTQMDFALTSQYIGLEEMEVDVQHQQTIWINKSDVIAV